LTTVLPVGESAALAEASLNSYLSPAFVSDHEKRRSYERLLARNRGLSREALPGSAGSQPVPERL
jgi:hypothetical protein